MVMKRRFHVLLTSAGRRVALLRTFREALDALGLDGRVLAADLSPLAPAFHAADAGFLVPRVSDPAYVDRLLALCREQEVDLVVPLIDPELPVLAAARDRFEGEGIALHVGSPEVCAIGGDKIRTHAWAVGAGLPTVRQALAAEVLDGLRWDFPAVVKPSRGSASIGVRRVRDLDELAHATRGPCAGEWLVQSVAPGVEYTVSVYVDRTGRARCAVPRRRLAVRAGEVSKGAALRVEPVMALAMRAAEALPGARGALNLQVFHDEQTGEMAIIELNPRFGGGFHLAWRAGARYSQWLVEEALGLPSTITDRWEDGLVMLRYFDAVFVRAEDVDL